MAGSIHGTAAVGIRLKGQWWQESVLGRNIHLTRIEHRLLNYLMARPNQPISKEELLRDVWQYEWLECTGVVEVNIYRLRQKIEEDPAKPQHLITCRGLGYQFVTVPWAQSLAHD
jgi:DNA-binding response OmpR family regulator